MQAEMISKVLLPVEETDLVTYALTIDGNPVSAVYEIMSMNIQEGVNKLPSASIVIRDGSTDEENFKTSDSGIFAPKKEIEILLGYHGKNETVFKGIIIANSHKINNHCCEMNIECKDKRVNMTVATSNRILENLSDDDIIDTLMQDNNLPAAERQKPEANTAGNTGKSKDNLSLVQANITDWDFIISRIDVNKSMSLLHNDNMIIKQIDLSESPVLFLTHGKDILELQIDMDTRDSSSSVETNAWDFRNQQLIKAEGEYPAGVDAERNPQPDDAQTDSTGETLRKNLTDIASVFDKKIILKASYLRQEDLQSISDSKMLKTALTPVKGKVKYQGSLQALPGSFINITGIGNKFNGKYFVSAIQHEYADGCWTTEATIGWDENFFTENIRPGHPASSTGQLSAIQGLHTGVVTKIEDPDNQYRVKVRLPLIDATGEGLYARIATLDAGNNRGTFFRPEIDDEVLVGFMNDDPHNPVILGMLHSSSKPAPLDPKDTNPEKGYVTRSAMKMIFNDEKKSLTIETPGGKTVTLDDDSGSIAIKDNNGNKVIMNADGITIESGKDLTLKAAKSIALSAPQISMKADASMTVESGGTMAVKGGGITEVKGSLVKIN
ncbi:MAG: type VI secretion system tip protein VgrG [Chitinophagaceae bacterium]|nr:type VI secretion system tip protein VgrG [Chitinophagaceae bacterium]